MPTHQYNFTPSGPVLNAYYRDRSRVSIITGPLGSAKTTTTCYKCVKLMTEQKANKLGVRPTRSIAIRNTYSELLGTTAKEFRGIFEDIGKWKGGGSEPPSFTLNFNLADGTAVNHELLFIALDSPAHVRKLRGHNVTWFWLSEVKELAKEIVDMADLRHGRYPSKKQGLVEPTWHGMLGDTNQCDEDHWLYDFQENIKPSGGLEDWSFFTQPGGLIKVDGRWVVNPEAENVKYLPAGYYEKGMEGKDDDWIKVNLANMYGYVSSGKPVHPEYNDSVHCCDDIKPIKDSPIVLGFDFGRTPACAIVQQIGDNWFCLDEFVAKDMSASKFGPELKRYLIANYPENEFIGWGDPSGANKGEAVEHSAVEVLEALGLPCKPCDTNDTLQRRSAVAAPLRELGVNGKPRLLICKKANMIRKGLAGKFCYRRLQVAGDAKYQDAPDKNDWSHPVEALEYALLGEGEGIKSVLRKNRSPYDSTRGRIRL